ncbi:hypothetical protein [Pseudoroseicyclus aestuarii]|uniref:Uncharacterized protein n=1 Tax=Pseudoroseicyclus aestuarii TaxID=1795041 RepID=A0A318STM5_9RHOB|nr:hypothetical protein [Pseudoroseicyclus aestuarii]PYE82210.1 hypothetical protein DFP88_10550 [Pseudoroseicyclus aestuarii]
MGESGGAQTRHEACGGAGEQVSSTMALRDLIWAFDPPPPAAVLEAAENLSYRDFLIVTQGLDHPDPFPDNWIYIHSLKVKVGRIQNFRARSPEMLPDEGTASIGMEYFCQEGDGLWAMPAARNTLGQDHDVWTVNVERAYHEEFQRAEGSEAEGTAPVAVCPFVARSRGSRGA